MGTIIRTSQSRCLHYAKRRDFHPWNWKGGYHTSTLQECICTQHPRLIYTHQSYFGQTCYHDRPRLRQRSLPSATSSRTVSLDGNGTVSIVEICEICRLPASYAEQSHRSRFSKIRIYMLMEWFWKSISQWAEADISRPSSQLCTNEGFGKV